MGRGLSADSRQLIQRAYDMLTVEHPSGVRRVAYALFRNQAGQHVKKLGKLLTHARKTGAIPWAWITDETRPERAPYVVDDTRELLANTSRSATYFERLDQFERALFAQALSDHRGRVDDAARTLGLSVNTLRLKLDRLDVDYRAPRAPGPRAEW